MITINLLPVKAAKRREFGRQQLILIALVLVLAAIGNFFWYSRTSSELSAVEAQISKTRAEIAQLEKTIGEVKNINNEKKALEAKLQVLDGLKKGRTGPVRVLDELTQVIPQKVWLKTFVEQNGGVTMEGQAATYEELSNFSKRLKASKHFRDITIKTATQHQEGGTVDWQITCRADYSA